MSGVRQEMRQEMRQETDSLGSVEVPADKLWGAQTQRAIEHFSIGREMMPHLFPHPSSAAIPTRCSSSTVTRRPA